MKKFAQSPAPQHIRLNPQCAFSEMLYKDKKELPVFSARAIENGKDAYGDQFIKQGFAFNEQMDLAWALGFPEITIVVDGAPEIEFPQDKSDTYARRFRKIISRRSLWANVHWALTGIDPITLTEEEYLKCTEERELTDEEIKELYEDKKLRGFSVANLEAIIGPEKLVHTIVALIEEKYKNDQDCSVSLRYLLGILRRVSHKAHGEYINRLKQIDFTGKYDKYYSDCIIDPMRLADNYPSHMSTPCSSHTQWLDRHPDITIKAIEELGFQGSFIDYRNLFTGSEKAFDILVKSHKKIERQDRNNDYLNILTTINTSKLVKSQLAVWQESRFTEPMELWFKINKELVIAELQTIGKKKNPHQNAANDMLVILGEKPSAPLVPKDKQKSLNPPNEWDKTFKQLEKLEDEIIKATGDEKAEKKAFKKHFKKCKTIADEFEYDWNEEVFIRAWAETPFDKMTEEQKNTMADLYEEIVVR